jgi:DNA-binding NarL/FixJ family response regulator
MSEQLSAVDGAAQGPAPLRVFILDDHELVRQGLKDLLEGEGFEVVGESGSAAEATRRIPALHPDIAILDGRLPDGTGIEVCRDVRSLNPDLRCLILTSYDDEQALRGAVLAGAAGYILKQIRSNDLLEGIRQAAAGQSLFAPGVEQRIIDGLSEARTDPRLEVLSPQEKKVLTLIGQGLTNRQIGEDMFLAEKTVKNYVSSILAKLGFERRTQAAVYVTKSAAGST